ncbi:MULTISPECIES: FAD-dependent monooxygenase [Streptomyces]|uniref:NAD(P)-binding protein n=4 Tax=Streptomyces rimosus TaxID=1927 RepID=L8ES95_STRR1|nr:MULTISPECIES: FAD-dependent monooxygenase [Streptomyces]KOG82241.1 FAD-dependent monooxygenase [Kitasatospora aureofaciens]MYT47522.1 NAD(P)-binding protein [Streptomyces sp. SID5471]KOT25875.1 FAD-dependent monooxygenase [Streptomyces sp. NRRL WC-3701]KOT64589.1 FAD-dependent monooxygenase [Streptomyces rimosus subsp. rimosus]KOT71774.1 FAD-dependent monooxygenase [Streptomyces rimosus subsp. rimosus]
MTQHTSKKILVIGAGIGGLTTAAALRNAGLDVEIYERAGALKAAGSGLSVMSNAIAALESMGLDLALDKRGEVLRSYHVRTTRGRLIREFPFPKIIRKLGVPSVLITRSDLQEALLAATAGIPITYGATAESFTTDEATGRVTVRFQEGREAHGDALIGADGFHSVIRRQLHGPEGSRDSGYICWLAVIPFEHSRLTTGSVTHYWGSGKRFGLVDVGGGRVYWWGTKNMPPRESANWRGGKIDVLRSYAGWADEIRQVIQATPEEKIIPVPSRDRVFLERWGRGPVTLLGDAAHPMLTSLGQGSAMAIEDAAVLVRHLTGAEDIPRALRRYEDDRRERARGMVAASRSISTFEQSENPVRRPLRDATFRYMPDARLTRTLEDALTFPTPAF